MPNTWQQPLERVATAILLLRDAKKPVQIDYSVGVSLIWGKSPGFHGDFLWGGAAGVRTPGAVVATRLRKAMATSGGVAGNKNGRFGRPRFFLGGSISIRSYWASIKYQLFWIILVSTRGVQGFDPTPNRTLGTFHVSIQLVEYPILIHAIPCPGACVLYARKISMLRTPVQ